jgi:hypothetical protein
MRQREMRTAALLKKLIGKVVQKVALLARTSHDLPLSLVLTI